MPAGVIQVKYTERWAEEYSEQAAYIAGEGWIEQFEYSEDVMEEDEEGEMWENEDLMAAEYAEAQMEAFLYKRDEQEWISAEQGAEVPVTILNVESL
jgi:ribulose bisphosphate carboxylase small subunit